MEILLTLANQAVHHHDLFHQVLGLDPITAAKGLADTARRVVHMWLRIKDQLPILSPTTIGRASRT